MAQQFCPCDPDLPQDLYDLCPCCPSLGWIGDQGSYGVGKKKRYMIEYPDVLWNTVPQQIEPSPFFLLQFLTGGVWTNVSTGNGHTTELGLAPNTIPTKLLPPDQLHQTISQGLYGVNFQVNVTDLFFLVTGLGTVGNPRTIEFDKPYTVVYKDKITEDSPTQVTGVSGSAVLQFPGTYNTFTYEAFQNPPIGAKTNVTLGLPVYTPSNWYPPQICVIGFNFDASFSQIKFVIMGPLPIVNGERIFFHNKLLQVDGVSDQLTPEAGKGVLEWENTGPVIPAGTVVSIDDIRGVLTTSHGTATLPTQPAPGYFDPNDVAGPGVLFADWISGNGGGFLSALIHGTTWSDPGFVQPKAIYDDGQLAEISTKKEYYNGPTTGSVRDIIDYTSNPSNWQSLPSGGLPVLSDFTIT